VSTIQSRPRIFHHTVSHRRGTSWSVVLRALVVGESDDDIQDLGLDVLLVDEVHQLDQRVHRGRRGTAPGERHANSWDKAEEPNLGNPGRSLPAGRLQVFYSLSWSATNLICFACPWCCLGVGGKRHRCRGLGPTSTFLSTRSSKVYGRKVLMSSV